MRCSRCHGLAVVDEWWSADNDYRKVEGIRCVNCGSFTHLFNAISHEQPSVRKTRARRVWKGKSCRVERGVTA